VDVKECLKHKIFWNKLGTTEEWEIHVTRMTPGCLPWQTFCCGPKESPSSTERGRDGRNISAGLVKGLWSSPSYVRPIRGGGGGGRRRRRVTQYYVCRIDNTVGQLFQKILAEESVWFRQSWRMPLSVKCRH